MNRPKISQMEAYMIETLRTNGITNEEIIHDVKEKDVSKWKQINEKFDFEQLIVLAEKDFSAFEQVINEGYAVKFVTVGGLERLLRLKFQKEAGEDYQKLETGAKGLKLDEASFRDLEQMLSLNWKVEEDEQGISVLLKEQKDFV
ncbi:hypothetical protein [Oceanobacillus neutriphilus]|uniref:Uncharacterized protein n=1 Tax=Oceanobacillus neutriphilus TaxID=531815 RepID=A0ABQ2NR85_9BACI|nr:hypothetical protein [Oceanobacillus neutriphilus]GGP09247.1 hypothetical protein GCM10011346_12550 [Oceanobacillus neutriphilus]